VVRSVVGEIYKLKPCFSLDAVVVGFTTRVSETDQVRSVLLGLRRGDGSVQLLGACGNFPAEAMRRELLTELEPLECPSGFRHSSSDGNLYRFVRPVLVLELSCTDLQTEDSAGEPIRRWVLRHGDDGWQPIIDAAAASMIHPVVGRRRPDKSGDGLDVRLSQLQELMPQLDMDAALQPRQLPASTVVRRQVWSKASKGGLAVRKLLVWQSHKQEAWPGWPAWVVHFTDYSPDRKTPLERTIRTALSDTDAQAIAEALIAENIKKGWEEVAPETVHPGETDAAEPSSSTTSPLRRARSPGKRAADAAPTTTEATTTATSSARKNRKPRKSS
jgi:hypothetical protein